MKFIEEVEDVFDIRDRGCVILPGIPYSFEPAINSDSIIEFRNPDGSKIQTKIQAFEMINRGKPMEHAPFSLPQDIKKTDISKGAIMFLVSNK